MAWGDGVCRARLIHDFFWHWDGPHVCWLGWLNRFCFGLLRSPCCCQLGSGSGCLAAVFSFLLSVGLSCATGLAAPRQFAGLLWSMCCIVLAMAARACLSLWFLAFFLLEAALSHCSQRWKLAVSCFALVVCSLAQATQLFPVLGIGPASSSGCAALCRSLGCVVCFLDLADWITLLPGIGPPVEKKNCRSQAAGLLLISDCLDCGRLDAQLVPSRLAP